MHCALIRGNGFHRLDGIYKPASADYSRVCGKNMGNGRRHAFAVLLDAHSRSAADTERFYGVAGGVSFCSADVLAGFALDDTRGATCGRRFRGAARVQIANCRASLDLRVVDHFYSVSLCGELHHVADHAQDAMARRNLRIDFPGTDTRHLVLKEDFRARTVCARIVEKFPQSFPQVGTVFVPNRDKLSFVTKPATQAVQSLFLPYEHCFSTMSQWIAESWKNFAYYAIPTRKQTGGFAQCGRKYPTSEQVVSRRIGKKECTDRKVRSHVAGELAGSSFSRLGGVFVSVQTPSA